MRWVLVSLGSLAAGVLSIIVSLVLLIAFLFIYQRYALGIPQNSGVGWDPVAFGGRYWKLGVIGVPLMIFGIGCSLGFWFFSKRLLR